MPVTFSSHLPILSLFPSLRFRLLEHELWQQLGGARDARAPIPDPAEMREGTAVSCIRRLHTGRNVIET